MKKRSMAGEYIWEIEKAKHGLEMKSELKDRDLWDVQKKLVVESVYECP